VDVVLLRSRRQAEADTCDRVFRHCNDGLLGFVTAWWQIVVIRRPLGWARCARSGSDALLSESVPAQAHGRAFGFETMMDTLGAVIGPAIALSLVGVMRAPHFPDCFIPGA